jgi:flagellar L-ring protein precursor FlgH
MRTVSATVVLAACGCAHAQSLMIPPTMPASAGPGSVQREGSELEQLSVMAIKPPRPREFKMHDLVTIVIDETSRQQAEQTMKTDKKYDNDTSVNALIDPWELLELRLRAGDTRNLTLLDIANKAKFDGKGSFERNDRLQMKIQAEIIDVKPNGVLVLEARKYINKNGETQETVLGGICRQEDVTQNNTIFSSQLANMSLETKHTGEVDKAGKKGLIPRVLETIFAF